MSGKNKNKRHAIFFVEGETEKSLLNDFKKIDKDPIKRIIKINLWNTDVKKLLPNLTEVNDIVIIFDTDSKVGIQRFNSNIEAILSRKHSVYLLQQTSNFEHELIYSCNCTQKNLFEEFCKKIVSADNFKNSFIKCTTRLDKLKSLGFSKDRIWSRGLILELSHRNALKNTYSKTIG
ncbi:TPA: hypothetical protein ACXE54_002432 [Klebsiella michiganensis]|uniref:RloB domain-containing protein n=1 Tax=Klebsiella michiganensis TaxID=1134687 RepID=A0A7H4LUU6_9ENTR|nr:hypothetical protein [Klebsiella aerogenes]MDU4137285.1 hypothetical protein [Klebsiella michiganensis]STR39922.1 Uncharacterised protein [Klebsiella michiganensis]STV74321.1 Uncharacterised protein [Klebsiella michiganensis]